MEIIHLAPPFLALREDLQYGGIERLIMAMQKRQEKSGAGVEILAPADSLVPGLVPTTTCVGIEELYAPAVDKDKVRTGTRRKLGHIAAALEYVSTKKDTILHVHDDYFVPFLQLLSVPFLVTLHSPYEEFWPAEEYPQVAKRTKNLIALSESHKRIYQSHGYSIFNVVHNGVEVERFPFSECKDDYLLSLSVISSHKGQKKALEAAQKTGRNLIIAGNVSNESYFTEEIEPHLTHNISKEKDKLGAYRALPPGHKVVYAGPVDDEQKKPLFAYAQAFLMPILWEEPFGLVMIEALACGTPVVAFNRGAAAEVVRDGKTGYIVETVEEMAEALSRIGRIRPSDCRRHVEQNFSLDKMVDSYLELYRSLAQ